MSAATTINPRSENAPLINVGTQVISRESKQDQTVNFSPSFSTSKTAPIVLGYSATVLSIRKLSVGEPSVEGRGESSVGEFSAEGPYQLQLGDKKVCANVAEGLLVSPNVGDVVLCVDVDNSMVISQVLKRVEKTSPLVMCSSRPIEWVAPVLRFKALKEMELLSVNKLTLSAADVVLGATRTLVQQASNMIQQVKNYSLTAKDLLRLNGRQQIIIAEDDIRMDAKRINMG
jgi:hypothetical protein